MLLMSYIGGTLDLWDGVLVNVFPHFLIIYFYYTVFNITFLCNFKKHTYTDWYCLLEPTNVDGLQRLQ